MSHIYKITNNITKEFYIGKTKFDIETRFKGHIKSSKTKSKSLIHKSIAKYGKENFTIESIIECDESKLDEYEIFYISELKPHYNMTLGGEGGNTTSNKRWVTNGEVNKYIDKDAEIPKGFYYGRKCVFSNPDLQKEFAKRVDLKKRGNSIKLAWDSGNFNRDHSKCGVSGEKNSSKRKEVKDKIKQKAIERTKELIMCPHCGKVGKQSVGMFNWHFDKCKNKND